MFGKVVVTWILGSLIQGFSAVEQSEATDAIPRSTLSSADVRQGNQRLCQGKIERAYCYMLYCHVQKQCQALCGSNNMSDCGDFGSYCKPWGPPEDGVGICLGFYYLPGNTTCFFNTHPDPAVCPEDRPVFCGGNMTTTLSPTTTSTPGPITTTTTAQPGFDHPAGTYAGNTSLKEATVGVSALFQEAKTTIQELNITISGVNMILADISYVMLGPIIVINYTDVLAPYRKTIEEAVLIYFKDTEKIDSSIAVYGVKIVMNKQVP